MGYNAIYRKYRPKTFADVVGQEQVVTILKNQLKNNQLSHAYIFTGTRGTGKTTVAKIFAKAVNCISPKDYSPCNSCDCCSDTNSMSVVEFDAASNNSVEQIKEIIGNIHLMPTKGKYRVYIIDEVHMLSKSAFNAFLKTLEEPPEHAIFILATTEIHQIPATILSRCMRLDFNLVPKEIIAGRIKYILDDLKVKYEKEAIDVLAEIGQGSVRDALSVTDTCLSYLDNHLTYNGVLQCIGASNPNEIIDIVENVLKGNMGEALSDCNQLLVSGKNPTIISREISTVLRNAIFLKVSDNANIYLNLPKSIVEKVKHITRDVPVNQLRLCMEEFVDLEGRMRYSTQQKMLLESKIILCSSPLHELEALVQKKKIEESNTKLDHSLIYRKMSDKSQALAGIFIQFEMRVENDKIILSGEDANLLELFKSNGGVKIINNILNKKKIKLNVELEHVTSIENKNIGKFIELFGDTLKVY